MFKDIELPFKLTPLEALSIVAFAAIGYSIIYKFGYYSILDITWFMYELTPINIVFSSIIFIAISSLSIGVGFLLYKLIYLIDSLLARLLIKLAIVLVFVTGTVLTFPVFSDLIPIKFDISSTASRYLNLGLIYAFATLVFFDFIIRPSNVVRDIQFIKYYFLANVLLIILLYPLVFGFLEGDYLIKNKTQSLSEVDLKDNKKWYLIHYFNDKFLLISGGKENLYKIVEYKDVNHIASKAKPAKFD